MTAGQVVSLSRLSLRPPATSGRQQQDKEAEEEVSAAHLTVPLPVGKHQHEQLQEEEEESEKYPLHVAAGTGDVERLRELASRLGVHQQDAEGQTALHVAAASGALVCVRELVRRLGADLTARDGNSLTPLLVAALNGRTAVVHLLVELGASIDDRDRLDRTALHLAAQAGRANTVRYLHNVGFDMQLVDSRGNTPLHLIAQSNSVDSIKLVLQLDGMNEIQNADGHTPYALAEHLGHLKAANTIKRFRPVPEELRRPESGPWVYIPLILPVFLDGSLFVGLIWGRIPIWVGLCLFWGLFFYKFGSRLSPRDGSAYSSPFAFAHVITLLMICAGSYFALLATHLDVSEFSNLHLLFWVLSIAGGICFYQTHRMDPGYCPTTSSGLLETDQNVENYGFCESCFIIRPLRSKHCQACNRCVLKFDHHW